MLQVGFGCLIFFDVAFDPSSSAEEGVTRMPREGDDAAALERDGWLLGECG